jgi:hypothetical protein
MLVAYPTISSVTDLVNQIAESGFANRRRAHVRLWFRGQSQKDLSLKPRVYRGDFANKNKDDRLDIERNLAQDFSILSSSIRRGAETDTELYFLQQHYRMPTRLLDWTANPLAALHFAVAAAGSPGGPEPDGELFMMDAWEFQLDVNKSPRVANDRKPFVGIATGWHPVFREAVEIITRWRNDIEFPKFIVPVRPHNFDVRINLQRSYFTFHVPNQPEINLDINPSLRRFCIPGDKKVAIGRELNVLGIDPFRIFGDLEHLAITLCEAHGVG